LPRWFKTFLAIDFSLVFITTFLIGYLLITNQVSLLRVWNSSTRAFVNQFSTLVDNSLNIGRNNLDASVPVPLILSDQFSNITLLPIINSQTYVGDSSINAFGNPSWEFYGIDFREKRQQVVIKIFPRDKELNHGEPIVIAFYPGDECSFGNKKACVYAYKPSEDGNIIFLSIHSGVGGEAQQFRHIVEGTSINRAKYNIVKVMKNLHKLQGAKVTITQHGRKVDGLTLVTTGRVPAEHLADYFQAPIYHALPIAANDNLDLGNYIRPNQPQLVFETCGWKMRGEPWAEMVTPTTASVYLAVIQK